MKVRSLSLARSHRRQCRCSTVGSPADAAAGRRHSGRRRAAALAAAGTLLGLPAACEFGGQLDPGRLVQITVALDARPDEVAANDTLRVHVSVNNIGFDRATIVNQANCFGSLRIFSQDGRTQSFRGAADGCWVQQTPLTIASGDSVFRSWRIEPITETGQAAPAGQYLVRIDFDARLQDGRQLPSVGRLVLVK